MTSPVSDFLEGFKEQPSHSKRAALVANYHATMDAMRDYVAGTRERRNDGSLHGACWASVVAAEKAIHADITEGDRKAAWPNDAFRMAVRNTQVSPASADNKEV